MESGCLASWEDLVHQYYPVAVTAFSGALFTEFAGKLSIILVLNAEK